MTVTLLISVAMAAAGVLWAQSQKGFGPLESVSGIAYRMPKWLFTSWAMMVGIFLMPGVFGALPDEWRFLGFLMVAGVGLVAITASYKEEHRVLHYVGAVVAFLLATVVTAVVRPWCLVAWVAFALAFKIDIDKYDLTVEIRRNWLLVAEVLCYLCLVASII